MAVKTKKKPAETFAPEPPSPKPYELRAVALEDLRMGGDLQCRERIDAETLEDYAARAEAGDQFPPLEAVETPDGTLLLWDGFHRFLALKRLGWEAVKVNVVPGTLDDARRLAVGANRGPRALRRSNADKRRAVTLAMGWWPELTAGAIAELAGVSQPFVSGIMREVKTVLTWRVGKDGKSYPVGPPEPETAKAGRAEPEPQTPPADDRDPLPDGEEVLDGAEHEIPEPAPELGRSHLAILEEGAREVADLSGAVGHRCALWKSARGQYRALFDCDDFGNWDQPDLPAGDYSPSAEAVAAAASRATGFAMTVVDWGPAPGGLETMWSIDLKAGGRVTPTAPAPEPPPPAPKPNPRTATLAATGLTREAIDRSSVVCKWDKAKGVVTASPVQIGSPRLLYVDSGGVFWGNTHPDYERGWNLLPLYTEEDYAASHAERFPPRDRPEYTDARRESGDCLTGVRVKVRGETYLIGPGSEKLRVVLPREGPAPAPEREPGDDTEAIAAEEERDRKVRPGKPLWDWKPYEAAFGALVRQVDALALAYRANNAFDHNNLLGVLRDFDDEFRDWQEELAKEGVK